MPIRRVVNSSHPREMPSGLRSQVWQIAIWGCGGGPSRSKEGDKGESEGEKAKQMKWVARFGKGKAKNAETQTQNISQAAYVKRSTL